MTTAYKEGSYRGWSNKATWAYSLDVFNNTMSHDYWKCLAMSSKSLEQAKDTLSVGMREYASSELEDVYCSTICDLVHAAIDEINFEEIAEQFLKTTELDKRYPVLH